MPPFFNPTGYNFQDFDLLVDGDTLYAVHMKKAPYPTAGGGEKPVNTYGLAKTTDGLHWEAVGDILLPGAAGSWEESLWAGGITKRDNQFIIYYSAIKKQERQASCQFGKAYSANLMHWEKDPANPRLGFDPSNAYYSTEPLLAFRDPFPFSYQDRNYILFSAKDKAQPAGQQGCVGIVEELEDGTFAWMPPLFSPGEYFDGLECPALYEIQGRWYLLYGQDGESGGKAFRYAIADSPFGPFTTFSDNQLFSTNNYGCRIVQFQGRTLLYHWFMDYPDGMVRSRLAPPKVVQVINGAPTLVEDGRLSLSDYE
ncbi:MAG: family 43 glycosylhydrolase [Patescibacteria group bacterium]|jgi:beta-xylosidase